MPHDPAPDADAPPGGHGGAAPAEAADGGTEEATGFSAAERLTIVATGLGVFMVFLDALIVNVALPDIQAAFGIGEAGLQWVVTAYSLGMAALIMASGTIADHLGRRRTYLIGVVVFAAGSAACAVAPDEGVLVAARAVQGLAAATVSVTALALVSHAFPERGRRVRAIGVYTAVGSVGTALGPTLGGVLTDGLGWRSVFYVNVPVAALAVVLTLRAVGESRDPGDRDVDLPGQALFITSVTALAFAVIEGQGRGWGSPTILGAFALFAVGLAAFVARELRTEDPMMDLRLFRRHLYRLAIVAMFVGFFAAYGMLLVTTQYYQDVRGLSALVTGLLVLPFALGLLVVSPRAGSIAARLGSRVPILVGLAGLCAGLALMIVGMSVTDVLVVVGIAVVGVGAALMVTPVSGVAMEAVPPDRAGMASGILSTQRAIGSTVGYAVLGAILAAYLGATLDTDLATAIPDADERAAVTDEIIADATPAAYIAEIGPGRPIPAASPEQQEEIADAADDDFVRGIQLALGFGAALCGIMLVAVARGFPGREQEEAEADLNAAAATSGPSPPAAPAGR